MSNQTVTKTDNMEQIRQLLFGEQMQQFHTQLTELQKLISELQTKLDRSVNDLKKSIAQLRSDHTEALQHIEARVESTRKEFTAALENTETQLTSAIKQTEDAGVARLDLANYFMEIGERLHRGSSMPTNQSQETEAENNE